MKRKMLLMVLISLFLVSPVLADTFVGSGGGSWTNMPVPNQNTIPFWDNQSNDVQPPNLGNVGQYLLAGLGGFPAATGQYWSIGGAVDNNVTFLGVGGEAERLLIEVAGNSGVNALYAYDVNNINNKILIFSGPTSADFTVNVSIPYAQYGFFLDGAGANDFYSGITPADGSSNFAFFRNPAQSNVWYVGVEDLPFGNGEGLGDYNDMIFAIKTVPLPPSALLLGSGLLGLVGFGWRRRKS